MATSIVQVKECERHNGYMTIDFCPRCEIDSLRSQVREIETALLCALHRNPQAEAYMDGFRARVEAAAKVADWWFVVADKQSAMASGYIRAVAREIRAMDFTPPAPPSDSRDQGERCRFYADGKHRVHPGPFTSLTNCECGAHSAPSTDKET